MSPEFSERQAVEVPGCRFRKLWPQVFRKFLRQAEAPGGARKPVPSIYSVRDARGPESRSWLNEVKPHTVADTILTGLIQTDYRLVLRNQLKGGDRTGRRINHDRRRAEHPDVR